MPPPAASGSSASAEKTAFVLWPFMVVVTFLALITAGYGGCSSSRWSPGTSSWNGQEGTWEFHRGLADTNMPNARIDGIPAQIQLLNPGVELKFEVYYIDVELGLDPKRRTIRGNTVTSYHIVFGDPSNPYGTWEQVHPWVGKGRFRMRAENVRYGATVMHLEEEGVKDPPDGHTPSTNVWANSTLVWRPKK